MYGPTEKDIRMLRNLIVVAIIIIGLACFGLGVWLF